MEKVNRELLIREISSRLPYGVKAKVLGWDEEKGEVEIPLKVYSVNTDGYVYFESNDFDVHYLPVEDCLLYLRPMESMTEEEKKKFKKLLEEVFMGSMPYISASTSFYDWLLSHHFDFRGLIPMGLAIPAKEGMYNNNPAL